MDALAIYRQDVARYRQSDDLVLRNLALALWFARRMARPGVSQEDLIGAANMGLLNARQSYDPSKGPFATYARRCMLVEMQEEMRRLHGAYVVSRHHWWKGARCPTGELRDYASPAPTPAEAAEQADDVAMLPKGLARLDPRSRYIMSGLSNGQTGAALGRELGVSKERIRQIKCTSFAELREFYLGNHHDR